MKKAVDIFSKQAHNYKRYRPTYPSALYEEILQFVTNREVCWDCGTGNGQVALALSQYFTKVYASDLSQEQLKLAEKGDNIVYKVERAEKTQFKDNQFNLITVAQAIHWFDLEPFYTEVKRVTKSGGTLAVWGYGLLSISDPVDAIIKEFYLETVGPYWNRERKHIDNGYRSIPFNFEQLNSVKDRFMTAQWNLKQLEGYLNSWSSVQKYLLENKGLNPVDELVKKLGPVWGRHQIKEVKFPVFLKVGRVDK